MPCCAAPNCSNRSEKGFKLYIFPKDLERRRKWVVNCRRDKWEPSRSSYLCELHFEDNQYEKKRVDGWRRLKQNAIPTIFNVPNPPAPLTTRRPKRKRSPSTDNEAREKNNNETDHDHSYFCQPSEEDSNQPLEEVIQQTEKNANIQKTIEKLKEENCNLQKKVWQQQKQIAKIQECLKETTENLSFLTDEQICMLGKACPQRTEWSQEAIMKSLRMRYMLGIQGYNYMRDTGYPLPSVSTLNRRLQTLSFEFGVINSIFPFLKEKIAVMNEKEKDCVFAFDEMFIANSREFDKSKNCFVGKVTLGDEGAPGSHLLVGLLRGLNTPWKQLISFEITGPSTNGQNMNEFLKKNLDYAYKVGLNVKAIVSDMGASNKALWSSTGVEVSRNTRITCFEHENTRDKIHVLADPPHLLKNLRSAIFKGDIHLSQTVVDSEDLPVTLVSGQHVIKLWEQEKNNASGLRFLHHLSEKHIHPNHFQKMKVSIATSFFSTATAAGLERAVSLQLIDKDALTTAWFIRLVETWFSLMTARCRKKSITARNRSSKEQILNDFVHVIQSLKIGNGWKPLQTGLIMSTLSMINLAQDCFNRGYSYLLTGRVNQDAVENTFSVLRQKMGRMPTAFQCQKGIKLICVSQFLRNTKNGNYTAEHDTHLFSFASPRLLPECRRDVTESPESGTSSPLLVLDNVDGTNVSNLTTAESNCLYFIAGSCVRAVMNTSLCSICINHIKSTEEKIIAHLPDEILWTKYQNFGGLIYASIPTYNVIKVAERIFMSYKSNFLDCNSSAGNDYIDDVMQQTSDIGFPGCCNVKKKLVYHFFKVRSYDLSKQFREKQSTSTYSSKSASSC